MNLIYECISLGTYPETNMESLQFGKSGDMTAGKIHYMDVVSHSRPIFSGVISTEDLQEGQLPDRDLRHEGHQVRERFGWVFTYQPRGMRTYWVEITQSDNIPVLKQQSTPNSLLDSVSEERVIEKNSAATYIPIQS